MATNCKLILFQPIESRKSIFQTRTGRSPGIDIPYKALVRLGRPEEHSGGVVSLTNAVEPTAIWSETNIHDRP